MIFFYHIVCIIINYHSQKTFRMKQCCIICWDICIILCSAVAFLNIILIFEYYNVPYTRTDTPENTQIIKCIIYPHGPPFENTPQTSVIWQVKAARINPLNVTTKLGWPPVTNYVNLSPSHLDINYNYESLNKRAVMNHRLCKRTQNIKNNTN